MVGTKVEYSLAAKVLKLDTAADAKPYADEIRATKGLTDIVLSGNTFGVEAGKEIASALKDQYDLERADLSDMFTGRLRSEIPLVLAAFGESLVDKTKLKELDLSDNAFGPAGAEPLQKLLRENKNIEVLKLNNNGLGIEGARLISEALVDSALSSKADGKPTNLRVVVIGRNRMESPGASHLAKAWKAHSDSLEVIRMPQNSIRPEGIETIMEHICDCKNLKHIDLQDNTFTEKGSVALAKALKEWKDLEILNVSDCLLSAKGGISVLNALVGSHDKLQTLLLQFNEIDIDGAKIIPEVIKNKPLLSLLELNGNEFDPDHQIVEDIKDALAEQGNDDALDELDEMEWEPESEEENEEEDEDIDELTKGVKKISV